MLQYPQNIASRGLSAAATTDNRETSLMTKHPVSCSDTSDRAQTRDDNDTLLTHIRVQPNVPSSSALTVARNVRAREDPARPSWILHPSFSGGELRLLPEKESVFWEQVMIKYLHVINEDPVSKERIHRDLITLRNNVVFGFFMVSAVWISLFMQLEVLQGEVRSRLFIHIPRIDGDDMVKIQPLGLIFLSCFSVMMMLQYIGMYSHRWGTILHTLSITDIGVSSSLKEQDKIKDILVKVNQLQRLRNIELEPEPDYEEPLPDYLQEDCQDNAPEHSPSTTGQGVPLGVDHQDSPDIPDCDYPEDPEFPPSTPPSYHTTDLAQRRGRGRRDVFDRRGNPRSFALENAFERRFRNCIKQEGRSRHHGGVAGYQFQHAQRQQHPHSLLFPPHSQGSKHTNEVHHYIDNTVVAMKREDNHTLSVGRPERTGSRDKPRPFSYHMA